MISDLKRDFRRHEEEVRTLHDPKRSALDCMEARTAIVDRLLVSLFEPPPFEVALIALGGYGRRELAFGSDIDLLFLHRRAQRHRVADFAEKIFYPLYDLGFEVGHAVRTLSECLVAIKEDHRTESSAIDSRFIIGETGLYEEYQVLLKKWFSQESVIRRFVAHKLEEGAERLRQFGGTVSMVEPNIKEGEGGLRDWHQARWIAKIHGIEGEPDVLVRAGFLEPRERESLIQNLDFLWKIRNALHLAAGRKDDQLTFANQKDVALWFGYCDQGTILAVERFMQDYYARAAFLHRLGERVSQRILARSLYAPKRRETPVVLSESFEQAGGVIRLKTGAGLRADVRLIWQAFVLMHRHHLPLSYQTLDAIEAAVPTLPDEARRDPEGAATWLRMASAPEGLDAVLLTMRETGFLTFFMPEFEKLLYRTQHDMYHVYTVDAHSLFAVGELAKLAKGEYETKFSILTQVYRDMPRKEIATMAILFHDIGKGEGSGHVERGVRLFQDIAARLKLDAQALEEIEYLVKSHLVMSHLAFRRDLEDLNMINQFAQALGSLERLDLLYLLTFCDIRAVGPHTWTDWKASSLEYLYLRTREALKKGIFDVRRASEIAEEKRREVRRLLGESVPRATREEFLQSMAPRYFIAHTPEDIARHCRIVAAYNGQVALVDWRLLEGQGCNEAVIYTLATPKTLANITGTMAANQINILEIQASVSSRGYMLYVFKVTGGQASPIRNEEKLKNFQKELVDVLSGIVNVDQLVRSRLPGLVLLEKKAKQFSPRVEIDNDVSAYYTVIDIYAHDRVGLLYEIASTLGNLGLFIDISRISTKVDQAADTFYVKDIFGQKIKDKGKLEQIRTRLLSCLEPEPPLPSAA